MAPAELRHPDAQANKSPGPKLPSDEPMWVHEICVTAALASRSGSQLTLDMGNLDLETWALVGKEKEPQLSTRDEKDNKIKFCSVFSEPAEKGDILSLPAKPSTGLRTRAAGPEVLCGF